MSETDCDLAYKLRLTCTAFIDSAIMEIRRYLLSILTMTDRQTDRQTAVWCDHVVRVMWRRDGVTFCDEFIALSNACEMITTQQEVDIFQIVYNIKQAQPHFFRQLVSQVCSSQWFNGVWHHANESIESTRVSLSLSVCLCPHDRTNTAESTITNLATELVHHEYWPPV